MLSTILKNVTANWVGLVANILLSFVMAPITVNALGSVYYGVWTLLMQFTGYLWLADFGVRESVLKYVAQYHASGQKEELVATVRTAASIYSFVAVLAMLLVAIGTAALPYAFNIPAEAVTEARIALFITGSTIAQGFVFNVFVGVLMGLQLSYRLAPASLVFSFARAGVVYTLLTNGYGIVTLAVVQAILSLTYSLLVYRMCRLALPYLTIRLAIPRREDALKLFNYGKYVLASNLGEKFIFATDAIVIAAFQPVSALTYYAIGGSLVDYLRSFIYTMGAVINPVASTLDARKEVTKLAEVVTTGTKAVVILGLPVCIGFFALGERFISLWMGPEYGPQAAPVLRILAIGFVAGLPVSTISPTLFGLGQHHHVAFGRIAEGSTKLILSVVLVQTVGITGVAIATAIPQFFSAAVYLPSVLPRLMPLSLKTYYTMTYLRPLTAAIPFALTCWGLERFLQPQTLFIFFVSGAASLVSYVVPCWFIALTDDERQRLLTLSARLTGVRKLEQPVAVVPHPPQ